MLQSVYIVNIQTWGDSNVYAISGYERLLIPLFPIDREDYVAARIAVGEKSKEFLL